MILLDIPLHELSVLDTDQSKRYDIPHSAAATTYKQSAQYCSIRVGKQATHQRLKGRTQMATYPFLTRATAKRKWSIQNAMGHRNIMKSPSRLSSPHHFKSFLIKRPKAAPHKCGPSKRTDIATHVICVVWKGHRELIMSIVTDVIICAKRYQRDPTAK